MFLLEVILHTLISFIYATNNQVEQHWTENKVCLHLKNINFLKLSNHWVSSWLDNFSLNSFLVKFAWKGKKLLILKEKVYFFRSEEVFQNFIRVM